ncbi:nose resistant to fluoxetine protein 6-like [Rhopalosiphum maidis]|uniref:nose resistant to fluoxetine protein 6-like n=1 Tax=Rhopalosiphum maidis TaxID=43146 RepID=UPI000F00C0D0|nr:nose resistant to fluoxetine protein 6-like [Rhopalosiphum maidis]XP_026822097.1 nose resistant to fluoxetine protein 6-like [Rhopalosiphum maidis]
MVSRFAVFSLFLMVMVSVNASLTGPTNILPTLPNAIIKSENSQCQYDSLKLQSGLKNMTLWAQQMWDASAKQAVGLLSGNRFQLGDFDECLQVAKPIKAQYCLVDVKLDVPPEYSYADPLAREYDPLLPAWHKIYYGGARFKQRLDMIKWALCVPASCSAMDVQTYLRSYIKENKLDVIENVSVADNMCTQAQRPGDEYTAYDIAFVLLIVFLVLLTTIATIFDYTVYSEQAAWQWNQESKSVDLIMCFSGRRAMQSLKHKNCVVRGLDLTPLCGTTTISMILIIIGHRWGFRLPGPLQNYEVNEQVFYDYFISIFTSHMDLLVDTFFAISGALLILILLDRLEHSFINPFKVLVFKYFRLTPVYAVIIFFFATLQYKMGSGPLWEAFIGTDKKNCQQTWWLSLLYLNNYVATDKTCGYHTWFMPCEFHFTIIGILLGYALHKKPKIGMYLTSLLMAVSIAVPFALTFIGQKPGNIQFNMDFTTNPTNDDYFMTIYIKSHTRAGPYIVGAIFGYLLYRRKESTTKLNLTQTYVLLAISTLICTTTWFSGALLYHPSYVYDPLQAALYGSTIRSVWAAGLVTGLYALIIGPPNFVKNVLSWKPFIPLASLNFNAYMVNTILPVADTASRRSPDHFDIRNFVTDAISDTVMCLTAGLFLYLLVERPFRLLITQLFASKSNSNEKKNYVSQAIESCRDFDKVLPTHHRT